MLLSYGAVSDHPQVVDTRPTWNGNATLVSDTALSSSIDRLWGCIGAGEAKE